MSRVRSRAIVVVLGVATMALCSGPGSARAALGPSEALTYLPFGFVYDEHEAGLAQETLAALDAYGIGQAILPLPKFKREGALKLTRKEQRTIPMWVAQTNSFDGDGGHETAIADFQGRVKGKSLDLEDASVRERMLVGIETVLAMGVGGVQLDLEPYPRSPGFILLLEEIDAAFARLGFHGRLSVCAPANRAIWSPAYLADVSARVNQLDPLFYDSELTTPAVYERWVREGLAYYSANAAPSARIVPVLPSYGPDPWHVPAVENIADATAGVEAALAEGDRVNGAGVFWWWAFYLEEEGAYQPAGDQAAWQEAARLLPFTS
jgi:hypothetical protein